MYVGYASVLCKSHRNLNKLWVTNASNISISYRAAATVPGVYHLNVKWMDEACVIFSKYHEG